MKREENSPTLDDLKKKKKQKGHVAQRKGVGATATPAVRQRSCVWPLEELQSAEGTLRRLLRGRAYKLPGPEPTRYQRPGLHRSGDGAEHPSSAVLRAAL